MKDGTRRVRAAQSDGGALALCCLAWLALALLTVRVAQDLRLALLWSALLLLAVLDHGRRGARGALNLGRLARGAALGGVVALPLGVLLGDRLLVLARDLYGVDDGAGLIYRAVVMAALAEESFFRGVAQERHAAPLGIGLHAAAGVVMFAPHTEIGSALLGATVMGGVGALCAYVYRRYGLGAALAAHGAAGLALWVLPAALEALRYGL